MAQQYEHKQESDWVAVQQRTFTKWCNNHLGKKGFPDIVDAQKDFGDGIKLMQLLNALYSMPIPKHKLNAKSRPAKLDNLTVAFEMVKAADIRTNFLGPTNLVDEDLTMILGMMWSIILDYAIKGISVDELTAKEGLLLWCRKKTAGYPGVDPPSIRNFHKDWCSGLALLALIHRHRPDLLNYDEFSKENRRHNIETAFRIAEEELDIPRLLDVDDLMVDRPDERSVMTYVAEYFHKFADQDHRENAAQRVANFLAFGRGIREQMFDYESRAGAFLAWVAEQLAKFAAYQPATVLAQAVTDQQNYRNYVVSEKPPSLGEKLDIDSLYAEIQTQLRVNGRDAYVPPEEVHPDVLDTSLGELEDAERNHSASVKTARFGFVEAVVHQLTEEQKKEFEDAFDHFDADKSGFLDKIEFKAALSAVGVPAGNDEAFQQLFISISKADGRISKEEYIEYVSALREDKATPQQMKASFQVMADEHGTITAEQLLTHPLTPEDVAWLVERMDGAPNYNYQKFVDEQFN